MNKFLAMFGAVAAGAMSASLFAAPAQAGTVILEGSDAIGFHCPLGASAACAYRDQTFSAIGGASAKPIAIIGRNVVGGTTPSGTHAVVNFDNLGLAGSLNNYVAIYFMAGSGCCSSNPGALSGRQADVTNYVTGGGTVEIGDYDGQVGWDFLVGGSGNSAFVAGIGGALSGPGCTDGERVNAAGLANGFTQPAPIGCWTHQAYVQSHFAALGFTKSFFDADPGFAARNPSSGPFSSLLSSGLTVTGGGVPEPATWAMMIGGFGLAGAALRRRRAVAA